MQHPEQGPVTTPQATGSLTKGQRVPPLDIIIGSGAESLPGTEFLADFDLDAIFD